MTLDLSVYADGVGSNIFTTYSYSNGQGTPTFNYSFASTLRWLSTNADATLLACLNNNQNIYVFYGCPSQCSSCTFNQSCSGCVEGYSVQGGDCLPSTDHSGNPCVGNRKFKNGVCEEFCHSKCEVCTEVWDECIECADLYTREEGDCVMNNTPLNVITKAKPFLALLRGSGIKAFLFVVSDLRLYEYHKQNYDGMAKQVFVVARFMDDKQWEIVGLAGVKEQLEASIEVTK